MDWAEQWVGVGQATRLKYRVYIVPLTRGTELHHTHHTSEPQMLSRQVTFEQPESVIIVILVYTSYTHEAWGRAPFCA